MVELIKADPRIKALSKLEKANGILWGIPPEPEVQETPSQEDPTFLFPADWVEQFYGTG